MFVWFLGRLLTTAMPFSTHSVRSRVAVSVGMALLLAVAATQTIRAWRYFPMFMGDQGWYLQVAARVSQGEVLYRDVAWAYGPLPAQLLATLLRWRPEAGLATAVNGLLAALSLLLTYAALRSLLRPGAALAFTAFAALAGPYVGGDLIRLHLYTYTQAVSWGMALSLAALVAALRWQRVRDWPWAAAAGGLAGLAFLSKPEFGVSAAGSVAAVLLAARAPIRAWVSCLAAGGLVLAAGFGWQASASGWQALWRGYLGYDMIAQGRFWGAGIGSLRWLASIACLWLALAALYAGWRWCRGRWLLTTGAVLLLALALMMIAPVLLAPGFSGSPDLFQTLGRSLQWLVAVPWALLTPILVAAAWAGRRRHAPPPWWGLWTYAILANLRLALTGYSTGLAIAPALAVLWWLATSTAVTPAPTIDGQGSRRWQRWAVVGLAALAAANLLGQVLSSEAVFNAPRRWLHTSLGPIAVPESPLAAEMAAIQADLERLAPAGAGIFATGWGPGWYLLAGRANPTGFDAVLDGLGASGVETIRLQEDLLRRPPSAVLLPVEMWRPAPPGSQRTRDADAAAVHAGLSSWWNRLREDYVEAPSTDGAAWVLLWRH